MLQTVAVSFRSSRIASARQAPARWLHRAGGALCLSVAAHAAVGVTAGTLLGLGASGVVAPPAATEAIDVDVVQPPAALAETAPPGAGGTSSAGPSQARRRRASAASFTPARAGGPMVVTETAATPARFVLAVGTIGAQARTTAPPSSAAGPGDKDIVGEGDVAVPARLLSASPLVYPPAARQAGIELDLPMEIVVDTDGRVVSARAIGHGGYGLEEAALHSLLAYRFSPALRDGRPVRVRMRWTVQFQLR